MPHNRARHQTLMIRSREMPTFSGLNRDLHFATDG
jgi:hypothetical protein